MKFSIQFIFRLLIVWLLFFLVQRLFFIGHYFNDFHGSFSELLFMPFHALRLDLSSASYTIGIPFIFIALLILVKEEFKGVFIKIAYGLVWFFALVGSILFSSELVSYYEWRTKLSSKIFVHFETPSEIFRTSSGAYTGWFVFYLILQLLVFYFLFRWLVLKKRSVVDFPDIGKGILHFITFFLMGAFLLGMGVRGGLQPIAVSATTAYYSNSQIVNDLAVNSIWNFINMTYQHYKKDLDQMYTRIDATESQNITNNLYEYTPVDTLRVLVKQRPNIIFVTLESWSGQVIGALGNPDGITPNFDQLCAEGLLFTNVYATSGTSETGHTSIFSGYPAVPGIAISSQSAKCRQLPSIFKSLKPLGYGSSYYFGGALSYGNIGGYLSEMGVEKLTDENDLSLTPTGNLGVHDEAMFPYFLNELKHAKTPYIYGLFTQSTHSPYDMPMGDIKDHPKNREGFVNSLVYADNQIKIFTDALRNLPDFENTIVVFVADHGKTNYVNDYIYSNDFYRIPLLIWGGALKDDYSGIRVDKIGSQSDIVKTLLNQMELPTEDFNWSKDLLDPNAPGWALLTSPMSFGLIDSTGYAAYHIIDEKLIYKTYQDKDSIENSLKTGRSLVETIYREYKTL